MGKEALGRHKVDQYNMLMSAAGMRKIDGSGDSLGMKGIPN